MIVVTQKGSLAKTNKFFERMLEVAKLGDLDKYGREGVRALKAATPVQTGRAAQSWYYKIERSKGNTSISWYNDDVEGGCNVAILLQYGHGTRGGTFVKGQDFINPALKPVFDHIADEIEKEVNKS